MAKGQHLSAHQQKIVKRYYNHLDTITLGKLAELVSELAVTTETKKADKLWERARVALAKTDVEPQRIDGMVAARNVKSLAELVGVLSRSGRG